MPGAAGDFARHEERQMLRVYLDNCCYNRPYDDQSQLKISMEAQAKLEIQQQIRDGNLYLTVSYIWKQKMPQILLQQRKQISSRSLTAMRKYLSAIIWMQMFVRKQQRS